MNKNEAAAVLDIPPNATKILIKLAYERGIDKASTDTERTLFDEALRAMLGEKTPATTTPNPRNTDTMELPPNVKEGFVKWFNAEKEYGFIIETATKDEIFFTTSSKYNQNPSSLELSEGQDVFFKIETVRDGRPAAIGIATHPYDGGDSPTLLPPPAKRLPAPSRRIAKS